MSDVTVAPNASPPPNSAPATEAPINQNPVGLPQPIGSQAPPKPVGPDFKGSEHRPMSRRETIQRAFERADTEARREQTKPAEAKMGHNQPPEEMPRERPRKPKNDAQPEDFNLHKRPTEQQQPQRGEHGHFARRQEDGHEPPTGDRGVAPHQQTGQPPRQYVQLPEGTPYREPPQRFRDGAKHEWHQTPEVVRGEIYRMHHEYDQGFRRFRADHDTMNSIRPYEKLAQAHGTTLQRALTNYVSMEDKLRNDVVGGLDVIVNNLNLRTPDGRKLNLRDIAYHILNQSPEQHQLVQSQNQATAQAQQIGQLHQAVNKLAQVNQQMQYREQFRETRGALDRVIDDGRFPRFDEIAETIAQEINAGYDLETAYRRADLLRPGTRAAQTRAPTAAQTRTSDRSIHGAPDGSPSNGASRTGNGKTPSRSPREAVSAAIKRVRANGSL